LYYNFNFNPEYVNQLKGQTIVVVRDEGLKVPLILKIIRAALILSFFITMIPSVPSTNQSYFEYPLY
jgi:hypothetical protein